MLSRTHALWIAGALGVVAFLLDLLMPLGVAAGVPYAALTLLAAFGSRPGGAVWVAAASTVLILLGALLSAPQGSPWIAYTNRMLAVACVWAIAVLAARLVRETRNRAETEERVLRMRQLLIPICAECRRVRTPDDRWRELAEYVRETWGADFTHGLCRPCMKALYPQFAEAADGESEAPA